VSADLSDHASRAQTLVRTTLLMAVAVVMLYPLLWLVGASFKSNTEIFSEVGFWPASFDFGAYAKGWKTSTEYTFATYFLNSFLITCRALPSPWSRACWWPMRLRASSLPARSCCSA